MVPVYSTATSTMTEVIKTATYKLNQIMTEPYLTISVQKTKLMAFKGGNLFRSKIIIANKVILEVNSFNC